MLLSLDFKMHRDLAALMPWLAEPVVSNAPCEVLLTWHREVVLAPRGKGEVQ